MTQIEVTFLGTTAGVPTKARNHACIAVKYKSENEYTYLWDCGEGAQRQLMSEKINFMRIDHIFITHWHADHFAGLLGLMETMNLEGRTSTLHIYGPEADKYVPILLSLGYGKKGFDVVYKTVEFEGNQIQTLLEEDEFSIISIPVNHRIPAVSYAIEEKTRVKIDKDKAKKLGLPEKSPLFKTMKKEGKAVFNGREVRLDQICITEKGKKVVYSGDTKPCRNIEKISKDADLLIHDTTFFDSPEDFEKIMEKDYKHATMSEVLRIAKKARVKQLILTHISRRYQDTKKIMEMLPPSENVQIAKDFMQVIVK